ncbi:DNA methyltransferase [Flavobacterium chungnamense]|uniref:Methyltransferase n=1 Tax=Flavobacterium chungnamense TaxID=706182 RepID=A0ABP7V221_9FLAO
MKTKTLTSVSVVNPQKLKINSTTHLLYVIPSNYEEILNNIREFGILTPLLVNKDYVVISGNLRLKIAIELKLKKVPVVFTDTPNEMMDILAVSSNKFRTKSMVDIASEIRFYDEYYSLRRGERTDLNPQMKLVKDEKDSAYKSIGQYRINKIKSIEKKLKKLHGNTEYSIDILNKQLRKIDEDVCTLNELDKKLERELLNKCNEENKGLKYEIKTQMVSIFNKDCIDMSELKNGMIQTIITSPPYYWMFDYGTGKDQNGQEKTVEEYVENLVRIFDEAKRVLKDDGSLFVNINDCVIKGIYQSVPELFLIEMKKRGWLYVDCYFWLKSNPRYTQGKRSVRNFEPIYHFVKSEDYYYTQDWVLSINDPENNISLSKSGFKPKLKSGLDYRDKVLSTSSSNTQELRDKCKKENLPMENSCTFPIMLPTIFVLSTSKPGDLILDMFSGTGTTAESCILLDRKYVGYEVNPLFIKASEIRLSDYELGQVA